MLKNNINYLAEAAHASSLHNNKRNFTRQNHVTSIHQWQPKQGGWLLLELEEKRFLPINQLHRWLS